MRWYYRWQQRLSLTRHESWALLMLVGLALVGLVVRHVRNSDHRLPPDVQAEAVRLFDERMARADSAARGPSAASRPVAIDTSASDDAVGTPGVPGVAAGPGGVDVNHAAVAVLERLPRIGPVLARRIVEHRRTHGPFRRVEDLVRVRGIGEKTLERLRPHVVVGAPSGDDPATAGGAGAGS